jgi:type VI secretion system protein ImpH
MEAPDRPAGGGVALAQALAQAPHQYSFYQAVRLLEAAYAELPRVGTSRRLRDDPFRIGQEPDLDFAPATLSGFKAASGAAGMPKLLVRFQGLTGPNGPLPLHITEYARDRMRNAGDSTMVHFFDVFHHRLLGLFYRAWAEANPVVCMDRPATDAFGRWAASLAGLGMGSLRQRDSVPDNAKLAATGLLARSVRNADGLATVLSSYFRVRAQVNDWHPRWQALPPESRTRLGHGPETAALGRTAVVGRRVWDCQSHFQVVLGPLPQREFVRLLPGQPSMQRLRDWVLNYCGFELGCHVKLVLKRDEVPPLRLGNPAGAAGQLGWTTWLGRRPGTSDADELELRVV